MSAFSERLFFGGEEVHGQHSGHDDGDGFAILVSVVAAGFLSGNLRGRIGVAAKGPRKRKRRARAMILVRAYKNEEMGAVVT